MNNKILLMKMLFSLLAFLFAACVHSQEVVDTVSVRVQYRALYKHTHEQKEAYDDINLLDIGCLLYTSPSPRD